MKRLTLAAACALSLTATPLAAQSVESKESTAEELAVIGELFGDMFDEADPLTAEQEARLPIAMQVVAKLMPEGIYAQLMDETMRPMMDGMFGDMSALPAVAIATATGLDLDELAELEEKRLEEAHALIDPDAKPRQEAMTGAFIDMITEVVNEIEPAYRAGLARAYATRFTKAELADLDRYFATEIGAKYAANSFLIFSDPQVMATMNEMMPAMMERMPVMMESIEQTIEKYDTGRSFAELSDGEKSRLAELLGVTVEELEERAPVDPDGAIEDAYQET